MQLTLPQFLLALTANITQGLSAEAGIVTLESGDTFDVKANAQQLQTLLMHASLDLKDAHGQLVEFISNQPDDKPYYDDTRNQLVEYRRGLEALTLPATSAPAEPADSGMTVSTDGGLTYQPAPHGVRIIYGKVTVPGEDGHGELYISASPESIVMDVWTTRDAPLDHNIGNSCQSTADIVQRLVEENA